MRKFYVLKCPACGHTFTDTFDWFDGCSETIMTCSKCHEDIYIPRNDTGLTLARFQCRKCGRKDMYTNMTGDYIAVQCRMCGDDMWVRRHGNNYKMVQPDGVPEVGYYG